MMLHVFAWSIINQDNNRDAWRWLFAQAVSNQVISATAPSATECRLCSDFESAVMAVTRPATTKCLLQKGRRPLCASSRAQGRRKPPAVAGSVSCCSEHRCPATAASQRQMNCCLPPACHRRRGLEIQPDLHSYSCRFHSLAYSMAYSMLPYHTFFVVYITWQMIYSTCYISYVHSDIACYIALLYSIAGCYIAKVWYGKLGAI